MVYVTDFFTVLIHRLIAQSTSLGLSHSFTRSPSLSSVCIKKTFRMETVKLEKQNKIKYCVGFARIRCAIASNFALMDDKQRHTDTRTNEHHMRFVFFFLSSCLICVLERTKVKL